MGKFRVDSFIVQVKEAGSVSPREHRFEGFGDVIIFDRGGGQYCGL